MINQQLLALKAIVILTAATSGCVTPLAVNDYQAFDELTSANQHQSVTNKIQLTAAEENIPAGEKQLPPFAKYLGGFFGGTSAKATQQQASSVPNETRLTSEKQRLELEKKITQELLKKSDAAEKKTQEVRTKAPAISLGKLDTDNTEDLITPTKRNFGLIKPVARPNTEVANQKVDTQKIANPTISKAPVSSFPKDTSSSIVSTPAKTKSKSMQMETPTSRAKQAYLARLEREKAMRLAMKNTTSSMLAQPSKPQIIKQQDKLTVQSVTGKNPPVRMRTLPSGQQVPVIERRPIPSASSFIRTVDTNNQGKPQFSSNLVETSSGSLTIEILKNDKVPTSGQPLDIDQQKAQGPKIVKGPKIIEFKKPANTNVTSEIASKTSPASTYQRKVKVIEPIFNPLRDKKKPSTVTPPQIATAQPPTTQATELVSTKVRKTAPSPEQLKTYTYPETKTESLGSGNQSSIHSGGSILATLKKLGSSHSEDSLIKDTPQTIPNKETKPLVATKTTTPTIEPNSQLVTEAKNHEEAKKLASQLIEEVVTKPVDPVPSEKPHQKTTEKPVEKTISPLDLSKQLVEVVDQPAPRSAKPIIVSLPKVETNKTEQGAMIVKNPAVNPKPVEKSSQDTYFAESSKPSKAVIAKVEPIVVQANPQYLANTNPPLPKTRNHNPNPKMIESAAKTENPTPQSVTKSEPVASAPKGKPFPNYLSFLTGQSAKPIPKPKEQVAAKQPIKTPQTQTPQKVVQEPARSLPPVTPVRDYVKSNSARSTNNGTPVYVISSE